MKDRTRRSYFYSVRVFSRIWIQKESGSKLHGGSVNNLSLPSDLPASKISCLTLSIYGSTQISIFIYEVVPFLSLNLSSLLANILCSQHQATVTGFRIAPSKTGRGSYILDVVCGDGPHPNLVLFSCLTILSYGCQC